jgi:signal transduction histidine kinase
LTPELIDLNDIIDDAIASAMKELREKNLLLRVDITDDLPEFEADRAALEKVLALLLKNAGTCTAVEGEITLRARAELKEREPGYILIQVSDTGAGIPPDDLPHIFSTVYRQRHKDIPGVGVSAEDLAEVKVAVEAHGGRIWVDSLVGQGSTFSTLFPLAEEGLGVR